MSFDDKSILLTTAQAEARPVKPFLNSIDDVFDELKVLPTIGKSASEEVIHPYFNDYDVEVGEPMLNNSIQVLQAHVRPYQIDPVTGLDRMCWKDRTRVFASPKQRLRPVPTSNNSMPRYLVTTGACTEPNYATGKDSSAERRRIGNLARRDHKIGGLVVDILDDDNYLMRHVQSGKRGSFVDLGIKYEYGKDPKYANVAALVLGDWHCDHTDEIPRKASFEQLDILKPKNVFLHDFHDGHSVTPHHDKDYLHKATYGKDWYSDFNLETELEKQFKELQIISEMAPQAKIYLVHSNHHDFLTRYLNDGKHLKEYQNTRIGNKLFDAFVDGKNPWEEGMRHFGELPKNIIYLTVHDDVKIHGFQLANHGHLGRSGGRGSIKSLEVDNGKSISGHRHSFETIRDTYVTGCNCKMNQPWMRGGPKTWAWGNTAIYGGGKAQHLPITHDGRWYRNKPIL